jgi:hypothetical protein
MSEPRPPTGFSLPTGRSSTATTPSCAPPAARGQVISQFPALARLAARHHWHELRQSLQTALRPLDWEQLQIAFAVPAVRAYGRRQITRWRAQDRSLHYLDYLAALA